MTTIGNKIPQVRAGVTEQVSKIDTLKTKLAAQQQKLQDATNMSQYLPVSTQAQLVANQQSIQAELAMLDAYQEFLETGNWDPDNKASQAAQVIATVSDKMGDMGPGWNDMFGQTNLQSIESDKKAAGASYAGTIRLENSGFDPNNPLASNALMFNAPPGTTKIVGKSVGTDLHMTVTVNGKEQTYVLSPMGVRPEEIYINAADSETGIEMDFSQVVRISDGNWGQAFGETNGLTIFGSKGNDTILGSQGNDTIIGNAGNDTLLGLGGQDTIYGDGLNDQGAAGFGVDDGNDIIDGGAGRDILKAGGGNNDMILNRAQDLAAQHENAGATETAQKVQNPGKMMKGAPVKFKDGTYVIQASEVTNGNLNLTMPEGYSMATAEMDSDGMSLVITMATMEDGKPLTAKIKIEGFFDPENKVHLDFHGNGMDNIIDFHNVQLKQNTVNLYGKDGNDVIMGPTSYLESIGLPLEDVGTAHSFSTPELKNYLAAQQTTKEGSITTQWGIENKDADFQWSTATVQSGEIILQGNGKSTDTLNFKMPIGFTQAVQKPADDGTSDTLLVFLKQTKDGVEQLIVRLKKLPASATLFAGGSPVTQIHDVPEIIGGKGDDTIFSSKSSVDASSNSNEHVISGSYPVTYKVPESMFEPISAQIKKHEAHIDEIELSLATEQKALVKETDTKEQKEIQKKIDELKTTLETAQAELKILQQQV